MRCTVVGGGAWGTALADLLARNGHDVTLWAREPEVAQAINSRHENTQFLPGVRLSDRVTGTSVLRDALARDTELTVFASPSQVLRSVAKASAEFLAPGALVMVATKGIERGTLALMSSVLESELATPRIVVLSGPSFAEEVAARRPTAVVAAALDQGTAKVAQCAFSSAEFRVYTSDDIVGVEVGGALKNVVAVAAGVAEGLGLGDNARAALVTRGLAEIMRLGAVLGARQSTFAGLAGIGDLVLTCGIL